MTTKTRSFKLKINPQWCKGCGLCVEFCPKSVLEMKGDKVVVVNQEACTGCALCEIYCPDFAIEVDKNDEAHKT